MCPCAFHLAVKLPLQRVQVAQVQGWKRMDDLQAPDHAGVFPGLRTAMLSSLAKAWPASEQTFVSEVLEGAEKLKETVIGHAVCIAAGEKQALAAGEPHG